MPNCELYRYVSDERNDTLLAELYSKNGTAPAALDCCDDYLICLYVGNEIWELHIFRCVSIYDTPKIGEMLIERRDLLKSNLQFTYFSDTSRERINAARVITHKNFVILAITDDNDIIENKLKELR